MTDTPPIVAFVRARIAETEQMAPEVHAASCPAVDSSGLLYAVDLDSCSCGWPKRVRARITADRLILAEHNDIHDCGDPDSYEYPYVGCRTVRAMASVDVDHPDYRPEWSLG